MTTNNEMQRSLALLYKAGKGMLDRYDKAPLGTKPSRPCRRMRHAIAEAAPLMRQDSVAGGAEE